MTSSLRMTFLLLAGRHNKELSGNLNQWSVPTKIICQQRKSVAYHTPEIVGKGTCLCCYRTDALFDIFVYCSSWCVISANASFLISNNFKYKDNCTRTVNTFIHVQMFKRTIYVWFIHTVLPKSHSITVWYILLNFINSIIRIRLYTVYKHTVYLFDCLSYWQLSVV